MNNDKMEEKPVTENELNLKWGEEEIIRVEIENLQMEVKQLIREVQTLANKQNTMEDKVRYKPRLYANAIIEDTSDFHNFWGNDKEHEEAEMSRIDFIKEVVEYLLVYCKHNPNREIDN